MSHKQKNPTLPLTEQENAYLEDLSRSRSGSVLRARRAAMLLKYAHGVPITAIAREFRCSAATVDSNIDMALRQEVFSARAKDLKNRSRRVVTAEMMNWIRNLSCQNPRNLGYSCVEWPASLLAQHIRDHCRAAGYHALAGLRSSEIAALLARDNWRREAAVVEG